MDGEALDPPERRPKSRLAMWYDGELQTTDLDYDEIEKGFPRNHDGRFGPGPKRMPLGKFAEIQRARATHGIYTVGALIPESVKAVGDVFTNPDATVRDRLDAARMVWDRVLPKQVEQVEVAVKEAAPWEGVFMTAIRRTEPTEVVQDAEVVEP